MMRIAILDAQGAGIGKTFIKTIRNSLGNSVEIVALGTNEIAAGNMLKVGADIKITGEEKICFFCKNEKIDCIVGPIGIICASGIMGEITSKISETVFNMDCVKYIIPLQKHGIYIPGTREMKIKDIIEEIINEIRNATN